MDIQGYWFPTGSSKRLAAVMRVEDSRYSLTIEDGAGQSGDYSALDISSRVGAIPRKLTLADGSVFETVDNDGVDRWLAGQGRGGGGLLHHLESRWHWIGVALVVVVMFVYGGARWGLPWTSEEVADWLPQSVVDKVSVGTMEFLDKYFLTASALPEDQRLALTERFEETLVVEGGQFTLHFRQMGVPNAFALPSGDLVATDKFVEITTLEEFDAVMFHEIGHVEHRHGMQQLVSSSVVSILLAFFIGDTTGVEEILVGLPVFLLQGSYSRGHEAEADEYAFKTMIARGIDPIHFATAMEKLEAFSLEDEGQNRASVDEDVKPKEGGTEEGKLMDYFSTHPATSSRIARAKAYSRLFRGEISSVD